MDYSLGTAMKLPSVSPKTAVVVVFNFALLAAAAAFAVQALRPAKPLDALLNEAPSDYASRSADSGLLWTLSYLKAVKPLQKTAYSVSDLSPRPRRDDPENPLFIYVAGPGDGGGAFSAADAYELRRRLSGGVAVVAEAGVFVEGTSKDVTAELTDMLGVRPTGWTGRYFPELSRMEELPALLVRNWERDNGVWNLKRGGLVLVDSEGAVIVLRDGKDLGKNPFTFRPDSKLSAGYGLGGSVPYDGWFSIIERSAEGTEQVAEFAVGATDEGRRALAARGIPASFPAVVATRRGDHTAYFFAGPFSSQRERLPRFAPVGYAALRRFVPAALEPPRIAFFWKAYVPILSSIAHTSMEAFAEKDDGGAPLVEFVSDGVRLVSRIRDKRMELFRSGAWSPFLVKGVNLGLALPNRWFTEMPRDAGLYLRWFRMISEMNANTVRLYTLAPPEFYLAFRDFNRNAARPLYLMQEIWPEEIVPGRNYLDRGYSTAYEQEIRSAIDAIHGTARIAERTGRAWGAYDSDVSPWTIAYLIGRELEPDEIEATDKANAGWTYTGRYISAARGTPSESWAARACDTAAAYETDRYGRQTPTAAVGWPILDPISHISEWNAQGDPKQEFNDRAEFNMDHIDVETANKAGFFGAYHIYPNYPDFMNNDPAYDRYSDEEGRLRYGGYLREFAAAVSKHPALVAEFGLANGMASAHRNPDGYDHGSLSEEAAAKGAARLMRAIVNEDYLGGLVFEWIDEWAKKTWTTEATMIPYDAHVHWHNMIDPEQNYGIVAMEAREPAGPYAVFAGKGLVSAVSVAANAEYLYLDFTFDAAAFLSSGGRMLIGLDTHDRRRGQFRYAPDLPTRSPSGMEFLIELENGRARLAATPDYNIADFKFFSRARADGVFLPILPLTNKARVRKDGVAIPEIRGERLRMAFGDFGKSDANVAATGTSVRIRLPWNALSISDPLSFSVLDDERPFNFLPGRDELRVSKSDGIGVSALLLKDRKVLEAIPESGGPWVAPPPAIDTEDWRERPKAAYYALRDQFARLP